MNCCHSTRNGGQLIMDCCDFMSNFWESIMYPLDIFRYGWQCIKPMQDRCHFANAVSDSRKFLRDTVNSSLHFDELEMDRMQQTA